MVKLCSGQEIRRHINHIRKRTDTDTQPHRDVTPVPSYISVDVEDQPEVVVQEQQVLPQPTLPNVAAPESPRTYPTRNRHPPERYGPVVSH